MSYMGMNDPARRGAQVTYAQQLMEEQQSSRIKQPYSRRLDQYGRNELAKLEIEQLLDVKVFLKNVTIEERKHHDTLKKLYEDMQKGKCVHTLVPQEQNLQQACICRLEEQRVMLEKLCSRLKHFISRFARCPQELKDASKVFEYILNDFHSEMGLIVLVNLPLDQRAADFIETVEKTHKARMEVRPTQARGEFNNIDGNFIRPKKDVSGGYVKKVTNMFRKLEGQKNYSGQRQVNQLKRQFKLDDLKQASTQKGLDNVRRKHERKSKRGDQRRGRSRGRSRSYERRSRKPRGKHGKGRRRNGKQTKKSSRPKKGRGGYSERERERLRKARFWKSDEQMRQMSVSNKRAHARECREHLNR